MKKEITISTITLKVALEIGINYREYDIEKFAKEANCNHYTTFVHLNHYARFPELGIYWNNGKPLCMHYLKTKCHLCDFTPDFSDGQYGKLYILNNGISDDEILVRKGKEWIYVPNTPRLSRMILLCGEHVKGYFEWNNSETALKIDKVKPTLQLELF
jgi:hypothetical protein